MKYYQKYNLMSYLQLILAYGLVGLLLYLLFTSGCTTQSNTTTRYNNYSQQPISMQTIDSFTARSNFNISKHFVPSDTWDGFNITHKWRPVVDINIDPGGPKTYKFSYKDKTLKPIPRHFEIYHPNRGGLDKYHNRIFWEHHYATYHRANSRLKCTLDHKIQYFKDDK